MTASDKTLIVSNEFPPGPGGIGNHAYNLAKYLNINGRSTDVITVSDFATPEEERRFDAAGSFNIQRHRRYSGRFRTYFERLKEIRAKLSSANYTHVIFSGRSSLLASLAVSKGNRKFISIAHGGDVNAESAIEKMLVDKALRKSDIVIPVSKYSASKITAGIEQKKICVIPNGFDFENITGPDPVPRQMNPGILRLVTVGTVWPRKGHHNVLRVIPELRKMFPDLKYNIVGRMADMTMVNEVMNEAVKESVIFHGQTDNDKMQTILKNSDIFILLSETQKSGDFEGFGIAAIEANYFGLPSIGSVSSGLEDAINNGVSGILVDPKNEAEVLNAVKTIAENYAEYSEGALKWATAHHWSVIIRKYIDAIERTVS